VRPARVVEEEAGERDAVRLEHAHESLVGKVSPDARVDEVREPEPAVAALSMISPSLTTILPSTAISKSFPSSVNSQR